MLSYILRSHAGFNLIMIFGFCGSAALSGCCEE